MSFHGKIVLEGPSEQGQTAFLYVKLSISITFQVVNQEQAGFHGYKKRRNTPCTSCTRLLVEKKHASSFRSRLHPDIDIVNKLYSIAVRPHYMTSLIKRAATQKLPLRAVVRYARPMRESVRRRTTSTGVRWVTLSASWRRRDRSSRWLCDGAHERRDRLLHQSARRVEGRSREVRYWGDF